MDTAQTTHISLCSGYGGIDLGLRRVIPNLRTVAYAEIEAFACELLLSRMESGSLDAAPIWSNLKSFPWSAFSDRVDILSGGYPCQPFSAAGKRLGTEDERHLWPFIADGIRILRPRVCFFENVEGHISLGLREVVGELESIGYKTTWGIFSAQECIDANGRTAPHQRKRVFILAHRNDARLERLRECSASQGRQAPVGHAGGRCDVWPSRPGEPQHAWEPPRVVGNAANLGSCNRSKERLGKFSPQHQSERSSCCNNGKECETQPPLGGDADGAPDWVGYGKLCVSCDNRTDELRLLGNGVVPAVAARAFAVLMNELTSEQVTKQPC